MNVRFSLAFWLGICVAFVAAPGGLRASWTPEKLYKKVLPSVMTLEVEDQNGERFVGSAVLALADDVALTAWHVVADARSVWAVFADGQRVKVIGYLDHDGPRDAALLKLDQRRPHGRAPLSRDRPSVASQAYVIGAPKGYDFSIGDGLISQIRNVDGFLQYQVSCPISPGNSGSPIFNNRGEVIGIASWTKVDAQNVSFAIPVPEFIRLNASRQPTTWEQLAAGVRQAPPARSSKPQQTTDLQRPGKQGAGDFAAFKRLLDDSLGKSVTVVVQAEGRTNTFSFTVK